MTRDEILNTEAGPEMDELINKFVFGVEPAKWTWPKQKFSATGEGMLMVDAAMRTRGYTLSIIRPLESDVMAKYCDMFGFARGKSLPEAVARAALLAFADGEQ